MVAVADDAFIHPEPGVSAGDHLASGLVPLAFAALLIVVARRLPDLVRGWLAIFAGALAIVGGATDGVRHVLVDRVSGDDVTAVLAGLAGIVLVALGVATLWRIAPHRRPAAPPPRGRRRGRHCPHRAGRPPHRPRDRRDAQGALTGRRCRPRPALPRRRADDERRPAAARLVRARSQNRAAVIAFPGRTQPVPHARMLIRHGYGVLMLDRRGEGASEGDYNAFGWAGEPDLRAAIGFLRRQPDVDPARIGGLGSLGRRRAPAPDRRAHARAARGRLRGRRAALARRAPRQPGARPCPALVQRDARADRGGRRPLEHRAAAGSLADLVPQHRAPAACS